MSNSTCYQRKSPEQLALETATRAARATFRVMATYDKLLAEVRTKDMMQQPGVTDKTLVCIICDETLFNCTCPAQWQNSDHRICIGCGEYFNKTEADQVTCELCTIAVEQGD